MTAVPQAQPQLGDALPLDLRPNCAVIVRLEKEAARDNLREQARTLSGIPEAARLPCGWGQIS